MPSQPQDQAKPSFEAKPELTKDSSRYAAPAVVEDAPMTSITGAAKVSGVD